MCAGISAMMGEACAAGADIPFLVTAETGMFAALAGTLNAPWGAAMLHGAKHMSSAGIIGGKVLKWINSIASIGGHVVTGPTTGGIGNVAISSYLRASNAALTASFCEAMGWAFVKDYKNGEILKIIREWDNISQEELGKLIGKDKKTIYNYEAENFTYNMTTLRKIAEKLDLEIIIRKK